MMSNFTGLSYIWHLHALFLGAAIFGAVLLLVWLMKHGKKETIATVIWITLVVGIIGMLFTSPWSGRYWKMMTGDYKTMMQPVSK